MFESEWKRMQIKLTRLMHDQLFTRRILDIPDNNEWRKTDDNLNKRLGLYHASNDEGFKVYFKGLVSVNTSFAGIGVAIYDSRDRCVFEFGKRFVIVNGPVDGEVVEIRALIEGFQAAVMFRLKKVDLCFDNKQVYHQYLTGKDRPSNKMPMTLINTLILIQKKIGYHVQGPFQTKQKHAKFAYKLTKAAIASPTTKLPETALEQCTICLEHISYDNMFSVNKCLHRYCYACMNKHVESNLLQGQLPRCPHENCWSKLEVESCKKFLNKNLYEIMSSRVKEAAIPPADRVYCPFPKCSALMSKTKLKQAASTSSGETGKRKCPECDGRFCVNCKVPWHHNSKCSDYKKYKYSMDQYVDELKFKSLAASNHWRECNKCMHMIELVAGCNHITCRCGYEFCYSCGGEWINKKAGCRCPLWELRYIEYA